MHSVFCDITAMLNGHHDDMCARIREYVVYLCPYV